MPPIVRSPRPFALVGAAVAAAVLAAPAVAGNGGFAPVPPESPNAQGIHQSYVFISIFCFAIFLLVEGLLITFVIRYRRRNRPRDLDGAQIHGAKKLELAWTAGPVLILAVIATFVFVKLPTIQDVPASAATSQNLVVDVIGTQFTWQFRYPNGVVTIDRMLVAEGSVDGAIDAMGVSVWDLAAVQVIVEEAGGTFTDFTGAARIDGGSAISSNGHLHRALLEAVGGLVPTERAET